MDDVNRLALSLSGRRDIDVARVLRRIDGWQRLHKKVPSWAAVDDLEYPVRLSLEQCSGEAAARYKAGIAKRLLGIQPDDSSLRFAQHDKRESSEDSVFADLTGGFGVDFSFLAPLFHRAVYIERNAELCEIARHNFPLLGLTNHEVIEGNGTELLDILPHLSLLMLDPARRDAAGRKTVLLEDCEPNVKALLPRLVEKADCIIVKLSPMLDLHKALEDLRCVSEVHLVAEGGECKELLLVIDGRLGQNTPIIHCADDGNVFSFTMEEERSAGVEYTDEPAGWLCEPNAAVLKAGAFKVLAAHYGLKKLHPNSHLYVSPHFIEDFPGRVLKIAEVIGFSKKELRALSALEQANLTVRNFPATVDELRKKLKLRDGGSKYLFATTTASEKRVLIVCER